MCVFVFVFVCVCVCVCVCVYDTGGRGKWYRQAKCVSVSVSVSVCVCIHILSLSVSVSVSLCVYDTGGRGKWYRQRPRGPSSLTPPRQIKSSSGTIGIIIGIMFKMLKCYIFIRPTVWGGKGREGVRDTASVYLMVCLRCLSGCLVGCF